MEGCLTAQSQRAYARAHPDIRFKHVSGKKAESVSVPFKGPYGIGTAGQDEVRFDGWDKGVWKRSRFLQSYCSKNLPPTETGHN